MSVLTSLGIDLSAKATGLVLLRETGTPAPELLVEREVTPGGRTGVQRARYIVTEIMELVTERRPDRIVVEGYSLGKNMNSTIPLVEIGGLLRFMLHLDGHRWYDPSAAELKKFVAGKGNVQKDQMMMWVLKRWGHTSMSNNTADGYGLAAIGLAISNRLPGITQEMRALAGKLSVKCN